MHIESLEKRLAPAGIVVATVNNGVLTLTGDAADNVLLVREIGPDEIRVSGFNGTSISHQGQSLGSVTFEGVGRGLTVKLQGGYDRITLQDLSLTGNLTTDMGAGELSFTALWGLDIGGNLTHTGGNGMDEFRVMQGLTVGGKMTLNMGGAADTAAFGGALLEVGKGLTIDGGAGDDSVQFSVPVVDITGSLNFALGKGANQVDWQSPAISVSGNFNISNLGHDGMTAPMAAVNIISDVFTVGGHFTVSHGVGAASTQVAAHSFDGSQLRVGGNVTLIHGANSVGSPSTTNIGFGEMVVGGKLSIQAGAGLYVHSIGAERLEVAGGISITNGNTVPQDLSATTSSTITAGTLITPHVSISNGAGNFENHVGASEHGQISGDVSIRSGAGGSGGYSEVAGVLNIGGDVTIRQGAGFFTTRISLMEQGPMVIGGDLIVEQTGRGPATTTVPSSLFIYGGDFGRLSVGGDMTVRFGNGGALTMVEAWSLSVGDDFSITLGNAPADQTNDNLLTLHEELRIGGDLTWRGGSGYGFSHGITAPTISIGGDLSVTHQRNTTNSLTIFAENRAAIGGLLSHQNAQGGDSNLTLFGGDFSLGRGLSFLCAAGIDTVSIGVNSLFVTGDIKLQSGAGTQNSFIAVANAAALYLRGSVSYAHGSGDGNFHISGGGVITGGLKAVFGAGGTGSFALSGDTAPSRLTINGPVHVSNLGSANHSVGIIGVNLGSTFAYTGSDFSDHVAIDHSRFSAGLQISLRNGADTFDLGGSTVRGAFSLLGGGGDDILRIGPSGGGADAVHFLGPVSLRLEDGNDTLSVGGSAPVVFHQRTSFDGGTGMDTLTMPSSGPFAPPFLSGPPMVTDFESRL